MSIIGAKRFQTGVFEALASQNRAQGSGGGSGLRGMAFMGSAINSNTALTITSTTQVVITNVSVSFNLTYSTMVFVCAEGWAKTSGGSGTFAYGNVYLDGSQGSTFGLWDKGNTGYCLGAKVGLVTLFGAASPSVLAPGSHTIDLRVNVDSGQTWINGGTTLEVFLPLS